MFDNKYNEFENTQPSQDSIENQTHFEAESTGDYAEPSAVPVQGDAQQSIENQTHLGTESTCYHDYTSTTPMQNDFEVLPVTPPSPEEPYSPVENQTHFESADTAYYYDPSQPSMQNASMPYMAPSPYEMEGSMPGSNYNQPPGFERKQKTKKAKKKFGIPAFIAVSLVSALLCGIVSSVAVSSYYQPLIANTSSGSTANKTDAGSANTTPVSLKNSNGISAVYDKASPSVVGIRVTLSGINPFFGSNGASSEGSGVVYSKDGYIITNYHVIASAVSNGSSGQNRYGGQNISPTIEVFLSNDSENGIKAEVVNYDITSDLAILKIQKSGLTPIEIGDSDALKIGNPAIALGCPGGLKFMGSMSSGIVSGLNRKIITEDNIEMTLIQIDTAINPGNSGGALVDENGKLIGINNSKMSGEQFEGMGFAIPVNEVVSIVDKLIKNENKPSAYLGITINTNYDAAALQQMGYPAGIVVASVAENSPAATAGIQANDIITKINDISLTSYAQLISEKNKYEAGDTITLTIYRNGQTVNVSVTLASN